MKLFHISDLHLGKRIYEFSMLEEQRELLLEILRSIDEEQPQALLISGDIYDKPVPPTEAVKLLDDFLTEVSKRGLHTYLIAGNHDSAQRLEFGKEIFGRESIHISGSIGEGLAHVTEMDEYGTVEIWLLPFFKPAHVNALLREERGVRHRGDYSTCLRMGQRFYPYVQEMAGGKSDKHDKRNSDDIYTVRKRICLLIFQRIK